MILGCFLLLSAATTVYSAEGPYMSANLGRAMANDSDLSDTTLPSVSMEYEADPGWTLGVAAGYDFGNNLRLEAEFAYQDNDLDSISILGTDLDLKGDASRQTLLLNGYYDFKNESRFVTFISAGIGVAQVEINDFNIVGSGVPDSDDDDQVFAYQLSAGISYAVTPKVNLDFKYRYFATEDPEFDTTEVEYSSNNVTIGIRVAF